MKDEAKTRINIDELLKSCGFILQDRAEFNRFAKAQGTNISAVATREFPMSDGSEADYLLFIEGKACGVIEAKKEGKTLSGTHTQSKHYATHLPQGLKVWENPLPFLYESNGERYFSLICVSLPHALDAFLPFIRQSLCLRNSNPKALCDKILPHSPKSR